MIFFLQELKKRLNEAVVNEEKLTEINNELNRQISQMVKDYDQDKREALDRYKNSFLRWRSFFFFFLDLTDYIYFPSIFFFKIGGHVQNR